MKRASLGVLGLILGGVLAISLTASANAASEVFVVSASVLGDAHYMESEGDGKFALQVPLNLIGSTGINDAWKYSFGNGLGDFDNDGDLDYIMAIGYGVGSIYIFEKLGPGNDFATPIAAGTWGPREGTFAKDLAVADFNEDGFADFVLSFDSSRAAKLYLADGDFGFTTTLLPDTAADYSAGADAADFNNDEHADFVIAPGSYGQFYVSLGDGKGNFTTSAFDSYDNCSVYGVAAADFTGDRIADIVAACVGKLYVYEGAGDGVTFNYLTHYPLPLNQSAIDNYDFNGDGIQDLVVANYAKDYAGVAVLIGDGKGYFTYDDTYLYAEEFGLDRWSLTGPPYEAKKNAAPVAVIEPTYLEVTAGEEIVFDGSSSYDEDGNIVSYEWNFGDGNAAAGVNTLLNKNDAGRRVDGVVNPSHIYYDSGSYTVTLAVTDDQGAESLVTAEVVVKAVPVTVKFSPHSLNLKSREKWIAATIQLPPDYDPNQVDRAGISVAVGESGLMIAAQPEAQHGFLAKIWRKIQCRMNFVAVKFDRQEIIRAIGSASDNTVLTVEGEVFHNGGWLEFSGAGSIQTFEKSNRWGFFKKSWRKRK